ncbi:hypothetical protein [Pedobacter sp. ASV28]|uniref:hypothetical protein n=1 Tax=Pedobacter sp. ASV28 TaxID=2795123 RepID=UPI0018EA7002|nr:hypothetical protein [Pedobacter sp. ASV28]
MKGLLISFLFIISYAFYLIFLQIIFGDNTLISVKGRLLQKFNFTKTEIEGRAKVDYIYLSFQLKGDDRFYTLRLATTDKVQDVNAFGGVDLKLKNAGELEVFIKKGDLVNISPKVYQIKADGESIFSIKKSPGNNIQLYAILLGLFVLFCIVWWFLIYARPCMQFKRGT